MTNSICSVSIARKADRDAMAKKIRVLAEANSAAFDVSTRGRNVTMHVRTASGLSAMISLMPELKSSAFLIHWFSETGCQKRIDPSTWMGGSINTCHYGKATDVEPTFCCLEQRLKQRLQLINSCAAFQK